MKTLSIKQPWAHLIVLGIKDIENRSWKTNYRGKIYVHASSKSEHGKEPIVRFLYPYWKHFTPEFRRELPKTDLFLSSIIGEVDIIDCVQNHPSIWADRECWNWVLANPIKYNEPIIDVKGKLFLWDFI